METTIVWGSVGFSRAEWTVKANRLQTHVRPIDGTLNDLPKMAFMSYGRPLSLTDDGPVMPENTFRHYDNIPIDDEKSKAARISW